MKITKEEARMKRKMRIRKKISGTAERPRLVVFRSLRSIYAQLVDDTSGSTLASASSLQLGKEDPNSLKCNRETAAKVGATIAKLAHERSISKVVFDRNGYLYHGRIKALADAAREAGLQF